MAKCQSLYSGRLDSVLESLQGPSHPMTIKPSDIYNHAPTILIVRIDKSHPLETQVQEQVSNPGPDYLQAARSKKKEAVHLRFFGIKSPQSEAAKTSQDEDTSKNIETTVLNGRQKLHYGDK
ncbi:hypothetical protein DSO57_1039199, partial [Entomophthora muscae]